MIEPLHDLLLNWKVSPSCIETVGNHPNVYKVKSREKTYYLKKRLNSSVEKRIEEQLLTSFLLENGLPVEKPLLTFSHQPYVQQHQVFYSLYQALEGKPVQVYSLTSLKKVGTYLSQLHGRLDQYVCKYEVEEWKVETHLREWIGGQGSTMIERWGKGFLGRLNEWSFSYSKLTHQLVHSDCHPRNILMNEERVTGVIDFDRIRKAPRIADVCYFLAGMLKDQVKQGEDEQVECIHAFMGGYQSDGTLTQEEKDLMPFLVIIFLLQYTFFYNQKGYSHVVSTYIPFINKLVNSGVYEQAFQM
ncbi:MAG: phosphotransferase enzyme family protein [Bacillota bacterium]